MMDTRDTNTSAVAENSAHNSSIGSKIKRHWILAGVTAVVALLCVWLLVNVFSKPKAKPPGPQPIPVAVAPV